MNPFSGGDGTNAAEAAWYGPQVTVMRDLPMSKPSCPRSAFQERRPARTIHLPGPPAARHTISPLQMAPRQWIIDPLPKGLCPRQVPCHPGTSSKYRSPRSHQRHLPRPPADQLAERSAEEIPIPGLKAAPLAWSRVFPVNQRITAAI